MTAYEMTVAQVRRRLYRMASAITNIETFLECGKNDVAYSSALTLADESERMTLLTRTLPAHTGNPSAASDVERKITEIVPVEIEYTKQGWFHLTIPALLPKKASGSVDYIRGYLYPAMRRFFVKRKPKRFDDCVLIYRHVYNRNRLERQFRDHDNIELNMVTDIVALYVMHDDTPLRCAHYYCSVAGDDDKTEVFVVPTDEFVDWLNTSVSLQKA